MSDQLVRVVIGGKSNELTYRWNGDDELRVGDVVEVPPPWWAEDTNDLRERFSKGVVTGIGSSYTGPTRPITRRLT